MSSNRNYQKTPTQYSGQESSSSRTAVPSRASSRHSGHASSPSLNGHSSSTTTPSRSHVVSQHSNNTSHRHLPPQRSSGGSVSHSAPSSSSSHRSGHGHYQGHSRHDRYDDEYDDDRESEEQAYQRVRAQIESVKDDSVSSTRNALRRLQETEQMAAGSLSKLQSQSEKLSRVESQMLTADYHATSSDTKTKELERLNRNFMIAKMSFGNPFGSNKRKERRLAAEIERETQVSNEQREIEAHTRSSSSRTNAVLQQRPGGTSSYAPSRGEGRLDDELDCAKEAEIDENLDLMSQSLSRLKLMGAAMSESITETTQQIERIDRRAANVNDQVKRTEARLRNIK